MTPLGISRGLHRSNARRKSCSTVSTVSTQLPTSRARQVPLHSHQVRLLNSTTSRSSRAGCRASSLSDSTKIVIKLSNSSRLLHLLFSWLSLLNSEFRFSAAQIKRISILTTRLHRPRSLAFSAQPLSKTAWTTSPHSTAQRLLLITCLLRVFLNYPATERCASETIVYFSACLEASVGDEFQRPCLEYFADYWLDKNGEHYSLPSTLASARLTGCFPSQ